MGESWCARCIGCVDLMCLWRIGCRIAVSPSESLLCKGREGNRVNRWFGAQAALLGSFLCNFYEWCARGFSAVGESTTGRRPHPSTFRPCPHTAAAALCCTSSRRRRYFPASGGSWPEHSGIYIFSALLLSLMIREVATRASLSPFTGDTPHFPQLNAEEQYTSACSVPYCTSFASEAELTQTLYARRCRESRGSPFVVARWRTAVTCWQICLRSKLRAAWVIGMLNTPVPVCLWDGSMNYERISRTTDFEQWMYWTENVEATPQSNTAMCWIPAIFSYNFKNIDSGNIAVCGRLHFSKFFELINPVII